MKTLTSALLATALISSPVLACGFGKSADMKMPNHTASIVVEPATEEAMSTFDPSNKPVFEETIEATEEAAPIKKDEISE